MAYLVKYGNAILFEPGSDTREMHGAKLSQSADGVAKFDFTLPPTHPAIGTISIRDLDHLVEVSFDGTVLFTGYIISMTTSLYLEVTVRCESVLGLLDGVMVRFHPSAKVANYALAQLIGMWANLTTWMNEISLKKIEFAVDPESQANQVGYVDPTPNTDRLIVDAETTTPKSILSILVDSIVQPYGAFIRMRRADDGTFLVGIFPNAQDLSSQVVCIGENLLDYEYTETDEGMYNACLPVGGAVDPKTGYGSVQTGIELAEAAAVGDRSIKIRSTSGTKEVHFGNVLMIGYRYGHTVEGGYDGDSLGTTAKSVTVTPPIEAALSAGTVVYILDKTLYQPDGTCTLLLSGLDATYGSWRIDYDIIYNKASVQAHGMRCMTFQDNDIRSPTQLRNKAAAMLAPMLDYKRSLTVSALDMAFYMDGYTHLQAGQKLRVISEPHGLDTTMYVRTADIDLDNPANTKYTLGTVERSLSRQVRRVEQGVQTGADNFIKELNNRIPNSTIGGLF